MKHLSKKLNAVLLFCSTYGSPMEAAKPMIASRSVKSMLHILSLFFVCMWSLLMAQELTKPWNYLELPQEVSSSVREEIWTNSVLLSFWKEFWFCSCFPHVPPPVSSCRAASVAMGLLLQPLWILEKVFSHCPVGIIQKGSRCVGSNTDADKESVL